MRPAVSVVTSMYRSEPYLAEFHARHRRCLEQLGLSYEFVFVDDGSPDESGSVIRTLQASDKNVKLVSLSRNFGQHPAMTCAIAHARGDYVYAADCDLEEPPENIVRMYQELKSHPEVDVIYGVLRKRSGDIIRNYGGRLLYSLLDWLSEVKIPHDQTWQRIMSRRYVDNYLSFAERETLPAGIMALTGFTQRAIPVDKSYKGSSSYSFSRRLKLALNAITSFSSKPLELIGLFGLLTFGISMVVVIYYLLEVWSGRRYLTGWASVFISIWMVGGLILMAIGFVGIYLAKVFNEVKRRPLYIVKGIEPITSENSPSPRG